MRIPKNDGSGGYWQSSNHVDEPKPKAKPEKVIKIRLRFKFPGQTWTADGPCYDLKAGDIIRMTQEQGLRLVAKGMATEDLTTPLEDLPQTNLDQQPEAIAAQKHPAIVAANERSRSHLPKIEPTQEEIEARNRLMEYLRKRRERLTGWV
ncbi:hypothetical protein ACRU44_12645 [Mycobacterium colombiense]